MLGFFLSILCGMMGAIILMLSLKRAPTATYPLPEFGKFVMLSGLCNLFVYVMLFFQLRKLLAISKSEGQQKQ